MRVEWDEEKNRRNEQKHGLSFEDVQGLFLSGDDYLEIYDEEHSAEEERFIAIGLVSRGVVMVVWTERDEDTIRIISARKATSREVDHFNAYMEGFDD